MTRVATIISLTGIWCLRSRHKKIQQEVQMEVRELRTLPLMELRVQRTDDVSVIEGHAAVFDKWSETLGGIFPFKEKVKRGAFMDSLEKDDIRALFNHDPNYVLGRNKSGTLELREDAE